MSNPNRIRVQLDNDQALVTAGDNSFHVTQRDRVTAVSSCPMHMMLGALGACIMLTLRAVGQHKGISLDGSDVSLDYFQGPKGETRFHVELTLADHLTDRERKILYQSARICEVGKILKGDVQIDYALSDGTTRKQIDPQTFELVN